MIDHQANMTRIAAISEKTDFSVPFPPDPTVEYSVGDIVLYIPYMSEINNIPPQIPTDRYLGIVLKVGPTRVNVYWYRDTSPPLASTSIGIGQPMERSTIRLLSKKWFSTVDEVINGYDIS